MTHTITKSPNKPRPKTTTLPQSSTFPPRIKEIVQVCHTYPSQLPEKMTAQSYPVAIGTRGTVGSLIMQEIEYFSRLELGGRGSSNKPLRQLVNLASTGEFSRSKRESVIRVPEKKKRGSISNRLIPSMCSMVEVAESKQPNTTSGFAYRNLKADVKRSQT